MNERPDIFDEPTSWDECGERLPLPDQNDRPAAPAPLVIPPPPWSENFIGDDEETER